jgi:DNA-binding beta-propeller fold protein YncE
MSFHLTRDVHGDTSKIVKTQQIPIGSPPSGLAGAITFDPKTNSFMGSGNRGSIPLTTGVVATIPVGVTPAGIAITPDGTKAYVANNNNYGTTYEAIIPIPCDSVTVIYVGPATNGPFPYNVIKTITDASFNQPYTITISGTRAYVTNSAGSTITIINTINDTVVGVVTGFDGPSGMVITPDGLKGYVINYGAAGGVGSGNGNTVRVVDLNTNAIVGLPITVAQAPSGIVMTSDGARVYTINYMTGLTDGTMSVIDTSNNSSIFGIVGGLSGPFGIVLSPDNTTAYVTNFGSNNFNPVGTTVSILSLAAPTAPVITGTITTGIQPSGIAIDQNGRYLYVSNYNVLYSDPVHFTGLIAGEGTVSVIDLNTLLLPLATKPGVVKVIITGQSPNYITPHPNGQVAMVSNFSSNTISVISMF